MALGTTNISILTVQNAIGVYSTSSLGALIAMAQSGGAGNIIVGSYLDENLNTVYIYSPMAFYINETYGSTGYRNGNLINGALPYWNRWSNKMPAEWVIEGGTMILRLKRNALNANGGYDYRLHDFRLYDHSALAPEFTSDSVFNATNGAVTIEWFIHMHQIKLPDQITHILVKATIGGQTQTNLIPLVDIIDGELVSAYSVNFTGVTETSGAIQAYASSATGTELSTLTNIIPVKSFTVYHVPQFGYLSRLVGVPMDMYVFINANVTVPSGSGNIAVPIGTTQLNGITIEVSAESTTYFSIWFDLYLQQTGQADKFVGSYNLNAGDPAVVTNLQNIAVTLNAAVAGNDSLSFDIQNLTY